MNENKQRLRVNSKKDNKYDQGENAILSAQILQLSEVAELGWEGARELIRVEPPEGGNE